MAGAGDNIPRSATLSTNNSGVLEFRLQDFSTTCQLRPESRIVIDPSQSSTFRYEQGAVWCQASTAPQRELVIDVGVRQLRVTQARFGLRRGQVVVDSGEGIISDADGAPDKEKPVPVRPGQACDMENPRVACIRYEPAGPEVDILERVERSHKEDLKSSTDSPPSKTPETTGKTPETTGETPETTGETPES
ncbi:MAG: FecR domain-containing protein [Pseudonocardiaceae bacterium]